MTISTKTDLFQTDDSVIAKDENGNIIFKVPGSIFESRSESTFSVRRGNTLLDYELSNDNVLSCTGTRIFEKVIIHRLFNWVFTERLDEFGEDMNCFLSDKYREEEVDSKYKDCLIDIRYGDSDGLDLDRNDDGIFDNPVEAFEYNLTERLNGKFSNIALVSTYGDDLDPYEDEDGNIPFYGGRWPDTFFDEDDPEAGFWQHVIDFADDDFLERLGTRDPNELANMEKKHYWICQILDYKYEGEVPGVEDRKFEWKRVYFRVDFYSIPRGDEKLFIMVSRPIVDYHDEYPSDIEDEEDLREALENDVDGVMGVEWTNPAS